MTYQLTTDGFATLTEPTTLTIQRWLPGPAERIWTYLTDETFRRKWLAAGLMDLVPGASFELVWRNDDLSGGPATRPEGFPVEERMMSRIIAADPPRLLTIAWGNGEVTFALAPKEDRVLLTLTHTGLDNPRTRTMVAAGWHMHLDILAAIASGATPEPFWPGWLDLRTHYESRLAD